MRKGKDLHQCKAVKSNKRSNTMDKNKANEADISLKTEKQYKRGEHPNSQANLEPFEKGISDNSGGRSFRYEQLKKALIKYGEKPVDILVSDLTYKAADENKCITSYTKTYGLSRKDGVFVKAVLLYGG
jgi:hypothetical protein